MNIIDEIEKEQMKDEVPRFGIGDTVEVGVRIVEGDKERVQTFIGTVIGISGAIGGLGGVFAEAGREEALAGVLADLRYAFDTTFVGLATVIPAMAVATLYRTRSDGVRHALVLRAMDPGTERPDG